MVINCCAMKVGMKKVFVAAMLCLFLAGTAAATLGGRINAVIGRASQKKVRFSVHIVKADSGKVVYAHNAHRAMAPASNMKIVVTAAALKYLGPDYEFKTQVGLSGDTLVVLGGGDPLFGDEKTDARYGRQRNWIFKDIAAKLKNKGVKAVKDIVVDSTVFDDERVHPNWPVGQLNQWYAAEVCGLNYNGNCVEMTVRNNGGRAMVVVVPETGYVQIINKVTTISKGKSAVGAYRNNTANVITVRGKCKKAEGPFSVAIERPAAFFGYLLAEHLGRAGVKSEGRLIEKAAQNMNLKRLAEYKLSMPDCLARCNKDSFGLAAEALLKTIAAQSSSDGSWAGGRERLSEYLLGLGVGGNEFYVDDGSGLSKENRLSANAITKVLLSVYKSKNRKLYKDSLAVGGIDGTIAKYFKEDKYKGKISGKTGYIAGVKSFSGVCSTEKGDFVFSILANGANGGTRGAINDIAKAVIDENQ